MAFLGLRSCSHSAGASHSATGDTPELCPTTVQGEGLHRDAKSKVAGQAGLHKLAIGREPGGSARHSLQANA